MAEQETSNYGRMEQIRTIQEADRIEASNLQIELNQTAEELQSLSSFGSDNFEEMKGSVSMAKNMATKILRKALSPIYKYTKNDTPTWTEISVKQLITTIQQVSTLNMILELYEEGRKAILRGYRLAGLALPKDEKSLWEKKFFREFATLTRQRNSKLS